MKVIATLVLLVGLVNVVCGTWLLSNKKLKYDPFKEQAKEEVGREDELFRRAVHEMLSDPEYIKQQRREHIRQHLGPFNGANLTYLFNLLKVKTLDAANEAVKYENLEKLDTDTRLKVLAEIAPKEIDDEGNIIPNVAVTSENIEEVRRKSAAAQKEFESIQQKLDEEEKNAKRSRGLLERQKNVFCFYNAHSVAERGYKLKKDFPLDVCTSVVYCCLGARDEEPRIYFYKEKIDKDSDGGLMAFLDFVKAKKPEITRHVAIGGPMVDYHKLSKAIEFSRFRHLVKDIIAYFKTPKLKDNVNLVWFIPEPHRLKSVLDHQYFFKDIAKAFPEKTMRRFAIVVPSSISDSSTYSYATQAHDVILLDAPEALDHPAQPACPISFDQFFGNYSSVRTGGIVMRPALFYSVTAGFLLKGYSYDPSGHPVIKMAAYEDVCKSPKDHLITIGDCAVSKNQTRWTATLHPETFNAWKEKSNPLKGIAIMDPEWDDFTNICGFGANPILNSIKQAIGK